MPSGTFLAKIGTRFLDLFYDDEGGEPTTPLGTNPRHDFGEEIPSEQEVTVLITSEEFVEDRRIAARGRNAAGSSELSNVLTVPGAGDNIAPTASISLVSQNELSVVVEVSASDADGTVESVVTDWGDGSPTASGQGEQSHTYNTADTYTITVTATDNDGATGTDTLVVTVSESDVVFNDAVMALSTPPTVYYPMDEQAGSVANNYATQDGTYDGNISDGVTIGVTGDVNSAFDFDRSVPGRVTFPAAALSGIENGCTIACRINTPVESSAQDIFSIGEPPDGHYMYTRIFGGGTIGFNLVTPGTDEALEARVEGVEIRDNTWHTLVVVYDGVNNVSMYIDGVSQSVVYSNENQGNPAAPSFLPQNVSWGALSRDGAPFHNGISGLLDECVFATGVWTQADVDTYHAG